MPDAKVACPRCEEEKQVDVVESYGPPRARVLYYCTSCGHQWVVYR